MTMSQKQIAVASVMFALAITIAFYWWLASRSAIRASPAEMIGYWHYSCAYPPADVTLWLHSDGTFDQTVVRAGPNLHHDGHWRIEDNSVLMDEVLIVVGDKWVPQLLRWKIVSGKRHQGKFTILGGAEGDPDCYEPFDRG